MTRIVLIDDHDMLLRGLELLFETIDGIDVAATTTSAARVSAMLRAHEVDVVVTDAAMPEFSGLDVVKACAKDHPDVPVLVLTTFDDAELVRLLMDAGASGYILKDVAPDQLAAAINSVAEGGLVLDPRVARYAYSPAGAAGASESQNTHGGGADLAVLTKTERAVAELVAQGMNNQEVASTLVLAEGTVKNHVSALLRKLDARDRTVLALRLAKALGL